MTEKDFILLTDFVNTTGDSVFDGSLKQALAVQLEQSPYLNVLPQSRIQEALRFMEESKKENKPFFLWWNATRMHIWTHLKPESKGKTVSQPKVEEKTPDAIPLPDKTAKMKATNSKCYCAICAQVCQSRNQKRMGIHFCNFLTQFLARHSRCIPGFLDGGLCLISAKLTIGDLSPKCVTTIRFSIILKIPK